MLHSRRFGMLEELHEDRSISGIGFIDLGVHRYGK